MPFLTHHSRHSWPPFISSGPNFETTDFPSPPPLDNIDEDPFAFFVSPQSETDDPFEDVSAGIASISHSSHDISTLTIPAKARQALLSRWERYVERHHPRLVAKHHASKKGKTSEVVMIVIDDADSPSTPPTVIEPERGRERIPPQKRGRRTSRTLSGHRHAWREPSVDLWTVMEEGNEKKELETVLHTAGKNAVAIETMDSRERLKKFGRRAGKSRL
ncbi:hypothetical protein L228DRAFT_248340 [Xylona heveae TC161]|uniref:Uncharacterized protein n=1 Tax=Xylona heveae (strain CBS 132557 / TC161) TaxID=1328760 RepID=A0A165G149_XYLHT|nr:hypothetical protein L228DRAFT_248340 [Xylona heveae TC161]KZF21619.1 hypothetical protein L228DRAFT_248340 [Xylona heveae TC161]